MKKRNLARIGAILLAAAIGAVAAPACDPYIAADTSTPQIVGLAVIDSFYNLSFGGPAIPDTAGCNVPYPDVDQAWALTAVPGACNASNFSRSIPSACPVLCYPPRTGPAFAPLYTGNLGGSYQIGVATGPACTANLEQRVNASTGAYETVCPTGETCCAATTYCNVPVGRCVAATTQKYTYAVPQAWVLNGVVSVPPAPADFAQFSTIAIVFNKLLDGKTVQPCPDQNTTTPVATTLCPTPPPAANLKVEVGPVGGPLVDDTASYEVIYNPNNAQLVLGAAILVQPATGDPLPPATQYHVVGSVKDQQGNTANVDVTVVTAP